MLLLSSLLGLPDSLLPLPLRLLLLFLIVFIAALAAYRTYGIKENEISLVRVLSTAVR